MKEGSRIELMFLTFDVCTLSPKKKKWATLGVIDWYDPLWLLKLINEIVDISSNISDGKSLRA